MLTGPPLADFRKKLLRWFRQAQRNLPWRQDKNPYRIWISEIMLQQTRVAAVIPYYARFLERFPDVRALAEAPQEDVLRLWSGLGYYSRARNLQKAAQEIVSKHGGQFPKDEKNILELPGIGHYTAAAILSIAFGARRAVLDGNVARVLARLGAIRGDLRKPKRWRTLERTAGELLAAKAPGDWNQAMMELGATVCTPRAPQCLLCPVSEFCRGRKLGIANSLPEARKKRAAVAVTLAAAVFADRRGHTLLLPPPQKTNGKAPAGDVATLVSRMWHFPTVSAERNPLAELQKLLADLLPAGYSTLRLAPLRKVRHAVTYRNVTVLPFRADVASVPRLQHAKTVLLEDISSLPVSNLTRKISRAALHSSPAPVAKR